MTNDFLRTFLITQLKGCRHVMIVHHTGCGLHAASSARFRERMQQELHVDAGSVDFLPWGDIHGGVREDARKLRQSPFVIREVAVTGHVYDLQAQRLRDVDVTLRCEPRFIRIRAVVCEVSLTSMRPAIPSKARSDR